MIASSQFYHWLEVSSSLQRKPSRKIRRGIAFRPLTFLQNSISARSAHGCWLMVIRRATGGWIIVRGERREVLTTSAIRRTAQDAIEFAIEAIDGGGMK